MARDGGDGRLAATGHALPVPGDELFGKYVDKGLVLGVFDIGAGGKGAVQTGQHKGRDGVIRLHRIHRLRDFRGDPGVERLGTVQGDQPHAIVAGRKSAGYRLKDAPRWSPRRSPDAPRVPAT